MSTNKITVNTLIFITLTMCFNITLYAQDSKKGEWISYPTASVNRYGVFHFRKTFQMEKVPLTLKIHISADNRYNLFVNGERVSYGPAKGDLETYKYDIVDIAPFLRKGKNLLAALVYNAGKDKPMSFVSAQTAFYINIENDNYNFLKTDETWKVFENRAYNPISYQEMIHASRWFKGYYACGPGDDVDAKKYPWGWEFLQFDDKDWTNAEILRFEGSEPWTLVPRNIPFMDRFIEKPQSIREVLGIDFPKNFLNEGKAIRIPPESRTKILLDFGYLTMGYPEVTINQGKGSSIKIKYAEALYEKVNLKAHRDSVQDKKMFGVWDIFRPDGKDERTFRPLWKRAFRYVMLEIKTGKHPLDILSFKNEYSGYPYPDMGTFESSDATLDSIFAMSNKTLKMCSAETYYDTPFYEQLSYGGDNRPIAAISTYNSTDDRLLREMLRMYPQSKNKETKLFTTAYPSRFDFDMGTWSMAWIQTLQDYYFMRGDADFVKQFAEDIEGILNFYHMHMDEKKGILATVTNKNFIDWSISTGSIPRSNKNMEMTNSTLLTLYYAHTLDCVVRLYNEIGLKEKAENYKLESESIKNAVKSLCWDESKKMFKDYPDKPIYSQHTNIMAILCDVIPMEEQQDLLKRLLKADWLDEYASSYFSFFLFKAMEETGMEHLFVENLDFWRGFLATGHTTCGETGFASHDRSDCHAWSAHPSYYLLRLVTGIRPADIGFNTVVINPTLGELTNLKASMPHQKGRISVEYGMYKNILSVEIILPKGLTGTFKFSNSSNRLKEGKNNFEIKI